MGNVVTWSGCGRMSGVRVGSRTQRSRAVSQALGVVRVMEFQAQTARTKVMCGGERRRH